jgi:hypothetical protein
VTAQIGLGFEPWPLEVRLAGGGGFVAALVMPDGVWPDGVAIALVFPVQGETVSWLAVVEGDTASWVVGAGDVDELLSLDPRRARLLYRAQADAEPLLWATGTVVTS